MGVLDAGRQLGCLTGQNWICDSQINVNELLVNNNTKNSKL
jgi:hypothetical protein